LGPLPSGEEAIEGSLLKLETVSRYDMGKYACEADNGFGNSPITSLVRVEVECKLFSNIQGMHGFIQYFFLVFQMGQVLP
jgi:hypothetical protein